ncbi:hypothetical protein CDL12_30083 [Handroanthus impetiginosus]|uniref:Uncharacterized protein n=1 Tax=Handroanthus impetiginosus TaxID=429701 RepID=A0A2G9FWK5_9LAMI|nr:hypothetical protein CDL12_30083 [Handroanthus impetiginosus]
MCFRILQISRKTCRASSLRSLGEGSLDIARFRAETSAVMLNVSLKAKRNFFNRENYKDCRDKYKYANKKIIEAISKFRKNCFASARKFLEVAAKVPVSCKKAFGDRQPAEVRKINETSDALF